MVLRAEGDLIRMGVRPYSGWATIPVKRGFHLPVGGYLDDRLVWSRTAERARGVNVDELLSFSLHYNTKEISGEIMQAYLDNEIDIVSSRNVGFRHLIPPLVACFCAL